MIIIYYINWGAGVGEGGGGGGGFVGGRLASVTAQFNDTASHPGNAAVIT